MSKQVHICLPAPAHLSLYVSGGEIRETFPSVNWGRLCGRNSITLWVHSWVLCVVTAMLLQRDATAKCCGVWLRLDSVKQTDREKQTRQSSPCIVRAWDEVTLWMRIFSGCFGKWLVVFKRHLHKYPHLIKLFTQDLRTNYRLKMSSKYSRQWLNHGWLCLPQSRQTGSSLMIVNIHTHKVQCVWHLWKKITAYILVRCF